MRELSWAEGREHERVAKRSGDLCGEGTFVTLSRFSIRRSFANSGASLSVAKPALLEAPYDLREVLERRRLSSR
jgi:hypothetical protein